MNQAHFPRPRPVLDRFLALNRGADVVMLLEIDEALETVPLCEAINQAVAVFVTAPKQVIRDPGIENTVPTIGHDVDEAGHERSG